MVLFVSCMKDKYSYLKVNDGLTAMNDGLIDINENNLFLNKVNDVTLYQLNGTQVKILLTYDRQRYQMMGVYDSFVFLTGRYGIIYKMSSASNLSPLNNAFAFNPSYRPSEIMTKDSTFIIFSRGQTSYTSSGYYNQNDYGYIQLLYFNKSANSIGELKPQPFLPITASSMSRMNDSLLFYTYNGIQCLNLNRREVSLTYTKSLPNISTHSYCIGNQLYIVSGEKFYHTSYTNGILTNFKEIK